jgi:hypothetical protein
MAKLGRKTKYTKETPQKVHEFAKNGNTREQIAHNLGISKQTLCVWLKEKSELSDALIEGESLAVSRIENAMFKRSIGYKVKETKKYISQTDDKGKKITRVEEITKHILPDVTIGMFLLKNKKPEEYKERQDVNLNSEGILAKFLGETRKPGKDEPKEPA